MKDKKYEDGGELPNYSGSTGPGDVPADEEFSDFSDGAGRKRVRLFWADITTPAPTLPPTSSPTTSLIVVSYDECNVVDDWVHSPNVPQDYRSNLACNIRSQSDNTLLVDVFATEISLFYFLLDWGHVLWIDRPRDIAVTSDSFLFWSSDYNTNHKRAVVC